MVDEKKLREVIRDHLPEAKSEIIDRLVQKAIQEINVLAHETVRRLVHEEKQKGK